MPLLDDLQALLDVQAVDTLTLRAQSTLAALDPGTTTAAAYNTAKTEAEKLRAAAVKAQVEQHDAEMRLQTIESKAAHVQTMLFGGTVTSAKELENLQKEGEMFGRQRGEAETKVLESMEAAGEQTAAAEAAETRVAALADHYRAIRAQYKERHAALSAEIAVHERERAEAIKPVPAALRSRYDALRVKKNGIGAATLAADGTCGGCHTRLNTGLTDEIKAGKDVQICEYCGRILVPVPNL